MKRLAALAAILLIPALALAEMDYGKGVNWLSLKDGLDKAKKEKKPVIVDFAVDPVKCPRCSFLAKNVYSSSEIVAKINDEFVPVLIDLGKDITPEEKSLGDKYDFKNDCMLLFLDYEANIIKDPLGKTMCFIDKVEPEVFIDYLEYVKEKYVPYKPKPQ